MKSRPSALILALVAAVLNIGMTAGLIYFERNTFNPSPEVAKKTAVPATLWSFKPDEIDGMIRELKKEREKLEARETNLGKLSAQIDSEKQELEKVRADIKTMREEMSRNIPEIEEAEVKNVKALAQTYSNVKPPAAVAIFKEMDDNAVVKILSFMKSDVSGAILGEMSKQVDKDESMAKRAARISDKLRLLKPLKKAAPQA
jgi:flagellar motility protein MotE (MotC chaperone)